MDIQIIKLHDDGSFVGVCLDCNGQDKTCLSCAGKGTYLFNVPGEQD